MEMRFHIPTDRDTVTDENNEGPVMVSALIYDRASAWLDGSLFCDVNYLYFAFSIPAFIFQ